jgi:Ca2+-transporting ATPase
MARLIPGKESFDLKTIQGLSAEEVRQRLEKEGYNELPSSKQRSVLAIAFEVVREPMFILLVGCGALYLFLGDIQEALMLLGFVFVVMGITLYQERKTERALEALRDLSSPRALVIREGQQQRIPGREVVRDDILVLAGGDRVPADAVLLSELNVSTDESLLTGESVPVRKSPWDGKMEMPRPGGDDLPFVYSGTLMTHGKGYARVLKTGIHTELGKIGKALHQSETEKTTLQKQTQRLVKQLTLVGFSLCGLVIVLYGLTRADWIQGILAGITLAMAMLPEEFPVVLTIFLALGAWRISQRNVLTRKMPAVETLGSATVLCVDKTGTLTLNQMTVSQLYTGGEFLALADEKLSQLPEKFHTLVEYGILASQRDPFDPMEKAVHQVGNRFLKGTEHLHVTWSLERQYPLSRELLALSHVWKSPEGGDYIIAAKGAPEAIADLCHLPETELTELAEKVRKMAEDGLRVLGVAKATVKKKELPGIQHDFDFEFAGLLGFTDPVRPGVDEAVMECHKAGIRVVMITGDYPGTARSIARQIRLNNTEDIITGPELDIMADKELQDRIRKTDIFARIVPEQKYKLVNALKANGEIVAMTGDGVNDAPALKSAHIGIAMGGRGTDVARESADLVLLDDNFSSIVEAVKLGRRIYDNLKKAVAYIFAVHIPIAGLTLLPVILKWPIMLFPVHIAFLELIIDPTCSVVLEAEPAEKNIMSRPPRKHDENLFGLNSIIWSLLQGVGILLIVIVIFGIGLSRGMLETEIRNLAFTSLILCNLVLIMANRSMSESILSSMKVGNKALWWVLGITTFAISLVLTVPVLRDTFKFTRIHWNDILVGLGAGLLAYLWMEALKIIARRRML